jgi:hypothetical protein
MQFYCIVAFKLGKVGLFLDVAVSKCLRIAELNKTC